MREGKWEGKEKWGGVGRERMGEANSPSVTPPPPCMRAFTHLCLHPTFFICIGVLPCIQCSCVCLPPSPPHVPIQHWRQYVASRRVVHWRDREAASFRYASLARKVFPLWKHARKDLKARAHYRNRWVWWCFKAWRSFVRSRRLQMRWFIRHRVRLQHWVMGQWRRALAAQVGKVAVDSVRMQRKKSKLLLCCHLMRDEPADRLAARLIMCFKRWAGYVEWKKRVVVDVRLPLAFGVVDAFGIGPTKIMPSAGGPSMSPHPDNVVSSLFQTQEPSNGSSTARSVVSTAGTRGRRGVKGFTHTHKRTCTSPLMEVSLRQETFSSLHTRLPT